MYIITSTLFVTLYILVAVINILLPKFSYCMFYSERELIIALITSPTKLRDRLLSSLMCIAGRASPHGGSLEYTSNNTQGNEIHLAKNDIQTDMDDVMLIIIPSEARL